MCKAARRDRWDHTANMLALTINVNRGKDTPATTAESIHPFERDNKEILTVEEQNAMLKEQMATLLARTFEGKVVYCEPCEPANAAVLKARAEARAAKRNGRG